jgi:hypothetical protein
LVIPAHPLALTEERRLDERRQRALTRYYLAAGAGGIAIGVHTTQFAIREAHYGLYAPVLELTAKTIGDCDARTGRQTVRIAGVCGATAQAVREAEFARETGYHAGLLSLGALRGALEEELIAHCHAVAREIPLVGFYLSPTVGGRPLPYSFWRRFAEIENAVAIKIAVFNRYQTIDVIRAVAEAGRDDIALYTGNDDNIVLDLVTPYCFEAAGRKVERHFVGGLLGHWAVWTKRAVDTLAECHRVARGGGPVPASMLRLAVEITDANAALFDPAHGFAGCIPGIHEVLRRQGLLAGACCLDRNETLSPGQAVEIDRVCQAYPHLNDDAFVREHVEEWLRED